MRGLAANTPPLEAATAEMPVANAWEADSDFIVDASMGLSGVSAAIRKVVRNADETKEIASGLRKMAHLRRRDPSPISRQMRGF